MDAGAHRVRWHVAQVEESIASMGDRDVLDVFFVLRLELELHHAARICAALHESIESRLLCRREPTSVPGSAM